MGLNMMGLNKMVLSKKIKEGRGTEHSPSRERDEDGDLTSEDVLRLSSDGVSRLCLSSLSLSLFRCVVRK